MINKFKEQIDINQISVALGFNGQDAGRCKQGECPAHPSKNGRCLTIYPDSQSFHCFHCGVGGDVIALVQLYKGYDFREAVDYLAEYAGVESPLHAGLSNEEREQRQSAYLEKRLVFRMLSEATAWCHQQLKSGKYTEIEKHLSDHYGFSKEIIESLQVGFLPPPADGNNFSVLAEHLESIPEFKGQVVKTGLFTFKSPEGPFFDFMPGRIIFPYWCSGHVRYLIGRKTDLTPDNVHEQVKYKKLRTHVADDEKRQHISSFIKNDIFMGEGLVRSNNPVIITEGAPDWVSARDRLPEIPAISPATTQFRDQDIEKLVAMTENAGPVYIINDNEENQAGHEGAVKTAKALMTAGKQVYIVELPRPDDVEKIDLNEYLQDHTSGELQELMENTASFLDVLIADLPTEFPKAQSIISEKIAPVLAAMDDALALHYIDVVRKKVNTTSKVVKEIINQVKNTKVNPVPEKEEEVDPEVKKIAEEIAADPLAFKKRIDVVNEAGIVGERKNIAMYFAAMDSRLLLDGDVIALKNSGHTGAGKSKPLLQCTKFYDPDGYKLITSGSEKSLYHLAEDSLKHRAFIVAEAFKFQKNQGADSDLVYALRSLISEGHIAYELPQKMDDGTLEAVIKVVHGPTSFITTTVMDKLEPQLEDRMFTIHPDESSTQTLKIIDKTAQMAAGLSGNVDQITTDAWRYFHSNLEPVSVVVPFATKISESLIKNNNTGIAIAGRRAFTRLLTVVKAITAFHQGLREVDGHNRVVADIADYWIALQIIRESFFESLGHSSTLQTSRMNFIKNDELVQFRQLADEWQISPGAVSQFVKQKVHEGTLAWCASDGHEFEDNHELSRAKRSGNAYLRITPNYRDPGTFGLPEPKDLTDDPDWQEGGKLLRQYNLELQEGNKVEVSETEDETTGEELDLVEPDNSDGKIITGSLFS